MTGNQPANLSPSACFVIERVPCEGYQVTSAEGRYANEWKGRALALLDTLGQPDPKGPAECHHLVGPITPSGEYVCVCMKLTPNGEAWYHQAWFQAAKPMTCPTRSIGLPILVMFVIFAAGAFAGRTLYALGALTTPGPISGNDGLSKGVSVAPRYLATTRGPISGNGGLPECSTVDPPATNATSDVRLTKLKRELASSRDVRAKLKGYLAQEEFAADTSTPVVEERRSVKLIADLDAPPPPRETMRLSNVDVAKLLRLLEALDEWTTNPKPPQKSEGR